MSTERDIGLVERYFDSELSPSEAQDLYERLKTDPDLRSIFDQEKALIGSIRASGLRRDLQHLKEVEKEIHRSRSGAPRNRITPWYFAAAAAVAVFVVTSLWLVPQRETPEELFQAYFVPVVNAFETSKRGLPETSERPAAYSYYDAQNFQMAADLFGDMLKQGQTPELLLLSANANLAIGNADVAKENLMVLIRDYDEMDMPAKWYLSLCYLKQGDVEQARTVLEELGRTEVSYTSKAKELLKKVN